MEILFQITAWGTLAGLVAVAIAAADRLWMRPAKESPGRKIEAVSPRLHRVAPVACPALIDAVLDRAERCGDGVYRGRRFGTSADGSWWYVSGAAAIRVQSRLQVQRFLTRAGGAA